MVKVNEIETSFYEGKEVKIVCFSCHHAISTHEVTFESVVNKQRIPLCYECLKQLFKETAANI
jgi:hypothetical protein